MTRLWERESETCTWREAEVREKFRWQTSTAANPTYDLGARGAALWQLLVVGGQDSTHRLRSHTTWQINSAFVRLCVTVTQCVTCVNLMTGFTNLAFWPCAWNCQSVGVSSSVFYIYMYIYLILWNRIGLFRFLLINWPRLQCMRRRNSMSDTKLSLCLCLCVHVCICV